METKKMNENNYSWRFIELAGVQSVLWWCTLNGTRVTITQCCWFSAFGANFWGKLEHLI